MTPQDNGLFPDDSPTRFGNGRRTKSLILPKYLRAAAADMRLRGPGFQAAHAIVVKWADLESSGKLFKLKEKNLHGEFLGDVFGKALGYALFSDNLPTWQLQQEYALPGGQTADGAVGLFTPDNGDPPRAVIELEGPKIDLDRYRSGRAYRRISQRRGRQRRCTRRRPPLPCNRDREFEPHLIHPRPHHLLRLRHYITVDRRDLPLLRQ